MSDDYELTRRKLRTAFEQVPADTRLTMFVALCYTTTLLNNQDRTGAEIYEQTWKMFPYYMKTFGLVDIIQPLLEAIAQDTATGVLQ